MTSLTEGKAGKALWLFTLPLLASSIFQQLYNIADTVIVGQFVGEGALAAVGASYPITMIFTAIAMGCNIGCSVIISQLYGAGKKAQMKTAISTSFIAFTALALLLTGLGLALAVPLMRMLGTPTDVFDDSVVYLNIYIVGMAFVFLYNIATGIFTAFGDSKTPLVFLIMSSVTNIGLDLLFVCVFHWGVGGAAWATVIAQGLASIGCIFVLLVRLRHIETSEPSPAFSWTLLKKTAFIAVPSVLQQSFVSLGNLFIQGVVNSFGSSIMAGYTAAVKLNVFTTTCLTTLATGISSYCAQNIGAGKTERLGVGFRSGVIISLCTALPFFLLYFFFSPAMVSLFMEGGSEEAMRAGCDFLKIVSPFYFVIGVKIAIDGMFRGAGAMKLFMLSTFADLLFRVALAYILTPSMGATGIWTSWPIGWTLATALSVFCYAKGYWKPKHALV